MRFASRATTPGSCKDRPLFYFTRRYSFALNALCFHYTPGVLPPPSSQPSSLQQQFYARPRVSLRNTTARDNAAAIINWFRFTGTYMFVKSNICRASIFVSVSTMTSLPPVVPSPSSLSFSLSPSPPLKLVSCFQRGKHEILYRPLLKYLHLWSFSVLASLLALSIVGKTSACMSVKIHISIVKHAGNTLSSRSLVTRARIIILMLSVRVRLHNLQLAEENDRRDYSNNGEIATGNAYILRENSHRLIKRLRGGDIIIPISRRSSRASKCASISRRS